MRGCKQGHVSVIAAHVSVVVGFVINTVHELIWWWLIKQEGEIVRPADCRLLPLGDTVMPILCYREKVVCWNLHFDATFESFLAPFLIFLLCAGMERKHCCDIGLHLCFTLTWDQFISSEGTQVSSPQMQFCAHSGTLCIHTNADMWMKWEKGDCLRILPGQRNPSVLTFLTSWSLPGDWDEGCDWQVLSGCRVTTVVGLNPTSVSQTSASNHSESHQWSSATVVNKPVDSQRNL